MKNDLDLQMRSCGAFGVFFQTVGIDYLQAIYEDECEILCVTSAQAKQISKILGSRVKDAFLQSRDAESRSRLPSFEIHDDEDDDDDDDSIVLDHSDLDPEEECPGVGAAACLSNHGCVICMLMLCGYLSVPFALPTPFKSCSYMPAKRAKGSQLNLSNKQPCKPMANYFNPHATSSASYNDYVPSNYNNDNAQASSSSRVATTDQSTDYVHSDYNTQAGPLSSPYIDQTLSTYGHNSYNAQAGPSSSAYTDQTLNPPDHNNYNTHADYAPPFNYNDYNACDNPYGTLEGLYNHLHYPDDLSSFDNMSSTAPNLHHIQVPQLFDDDKAELSLEAQYDPITTGEIPESQHAHAMPGTPYPTHQNPVIQPNVAAMAQGTGTMQATASHTGAPGENCYFEVTGAVHDQIFQHTKDLVVGIVFTEDVMASSSANKKVSSDPSFDKQPQSFQDFKEHRTGKIKAKMAQRYGRW
ncbi:hypothetical protein BDR05DRAFT_947218 [Suillus weaverae]|nr:hypothetical protein BDR05DRAFT_947218 [Suillus weaverae]